MKTVFVSGERFPSGKTSVAHTLQKLGLSCTIKEVTDCKVEQKTDVLVFVTRTLSQESLRPLIEMKHPGFVRSLVIFARQCDQKTFDSAVSFINLRSIETASWKIIFYVATTNPMNSPLPDPALHALFASLLS